MSNWKSLKIRIKRRFIDPLSGFLYFRGCVGLSYDELVIDQATELPGTPEGELTDVTAYFPPKTDVRVLATEMKALVSELVELNGAFVIESAEVEDFGWADKWKEFFRPIRVGKSIVVAPSWEKPDSKEGEIVLVIDPGEAFGTGSHETTRLCMEIIEGEFEKSVPGRCLDLGCGTGILGILMAKMGAGSVRGVDVDERAVEISKKNARDNGVDSLFTPDCGVIGKMNGGYDFVAANIVAEVLVDMKVEMARLALKGGRMILSGILIEKVDWVAEEFRGEGFVVARAEFEGSWGALLLVRE